MTMITSKMREKARLYESRSDWANAAACWRDAVALHSTPFPQSGSLAERDLANMRQWALDCEYAARQTDTQS